MEFYREEEVHKGQNAGGKSFILPASILTDCSGLLPYEPENQCVGLPVHELDAELAAGARPGPLRLPDVRIHSSGRIITERARSAGQRGFHRVDRAERITLYLP